MLLIHTIYPTSKALQNNSVEQPYVEGKGYDYAWGLHSKGFHSATNS